MRFAAQLAGGLSMFIRTLCTGMLAMAVGLAPTTAFAGKPPATKGGNPHLTTTSRPTTPPANGAAAKPTKTTTTTHGNPHSKTTTPKSSTSTSTTTTTTTLNPIAQKISTNHGLSSKVQGLLPANMTLDQASRGFKNQGQFIAALHVSQNLNIDFADLKTAMTGIDPRLPADAQPTSTSTLSLGQAIQKLRPSADADDATKTAEHQASIDTSGTTTTAKAPKKKTGR
jgi:hypothetical protein